MESGEKNSMEEEKHNPNVSYRLRYWFVPPWGFSIKQEEKLYLEYTKHQRQKAIPRFLVVGVLMQAFTALVPGERDWVFAYASMIVALLANLTLAGLYICFEKARTVVSHITWLLLWAQLLVSASRRLGDSYNELLGWAMVLQYFTISTLPFRVVTLTIYSLLSVSAYIFVQYLNANSSESRLPDDFTYQQFANVCMLMSATLLGATSFAINENQQRRSFQDTKRSLRDKLTIEQQSKEQERLLLSVLPEHVAVEMRRDLGLIDTQFKKIYMSRHENVSILYADIVGFTAISSTYSAQDLVAILNELFARFDRLAEKYQQLRIKILGDCYYCISGAPVERADHAVLCVHMGLSMVKAIKYVQQTTNSPVDMRVGIHTGAVLAGVLGQRQWQFDVYSRDVELANKMESSGMAGRVHISEVTLSFLNDEFEVEPAYGEKREEMLRQAGIKTYFIARVLKPYQGGAGEEGDALSDLRDDDEDSVMSPEREKEDENEATVIQKMLEEELVNRDDDKELADVTTVCLSFKTRDAEQSYVKRCDPCPTAILAPPLFLLPPVLILASFAQPASWASHLSYAGFLAESGIGCVIFYATYRITMIKKKYVDPDKRQIFTMVNLGAFTTATFLPLFVCGEYERRLQEGVNDGEISASRAGASTRRCIHPSYYYHLIVYILCCVLWLAPSSCERRVVLAVLVVGVHAAIAVWNPALLAPRASLDRDPYLRHDADNATLPYDQDIVDFMAQIHHGRHLVMLCLIALALLIYDRYLESLDRARHSRAERMRKQAEQAGDLRRRNQALVYNVLPPHVARHFMGAHRHHRDLYSQSYAEVGVLFASMPNFTEFYSEETVNNQGLECLRFLNEVISDFDLLLEDPRFRDIIKIKTISSTYMAASGLNPTRQMQPNDGVLVRWAHLACLVEFALELQRVLAAINEQSFNHFVLRMGVNHGPITAGVIGARKPHYDIWGNTVNVASRMESTGKAGAIQVTEETCHILESFCYFFEQRGLVAVKGKGQLMTYYLQGKRDNGHRSNDKQTVDNDNAGEAPLSNGDVTASTKQDDSDAGKPLLS